MLNVVTILKIYGRSLYDSQNVGPEYQIFLIDNGVAILRFKVSVNALYVYDRVLFVSCGSCVYHAFYDARLGCGRTSGITGLRKRKVA